MAHLARAPRTGYAAATAGPPVPYRRGGVRCLSGERHHDDRRRLEPPLAYDFGRIRVYTDTLQQRESSGARPLPLSAGAGLPLRRACPVPPTNIAATPPTPFPCRTGTADVVAGSVLKFCRDSVELVDGQGTWVKDLVNEAGFATAVEIHGNASTDGPTGAYNVTLSCMRAIAVRDLLAAHGVKAPTTLVAHGPTTAYGPAEANRNVVLRMDLRRCGPDATSWFLRQVAAAKTDPEVLAIRQGLQDAARLAAPFGLSAQRVAEGAVLEKVLEAERTAGMPPRTPEATGQIAAARPGAAEFARAKIALAVGATDLIPGVPPRSGRRTSDLLLSLLLIRRAAQRWAGLVGTRRRYDFKWDTGTMRRPTTPNCPTSCADTITLCPNTASDCYRTDVPGNIFYAHVGRFAGWSELALQLGSEFAQLSSTRTWDPPEDTQLIAASFAMRDPLTFAELFAMLATNRSIFSLQPCLNCSEETRAVIR